MSAEQLRFELIPANRLLMRRLLRKCFWENVRQCGDNGANASSDMQMSSTIEAGLHIAQGLSQTVWRTACIRLTRMRTALLSRFFFYSCEAAGDSKYIFVNAGAQYGRLQ
jgi:hypothetical protein